MHSVSLLLALKDAVKKEIKALVVHVIGAAAATKKLVHDELDRNMVQLVAWSRREVRVLDDETPVQYSVRKLGGYRYHLKSADPKSIRADHSYHSIAGAFPTIHRRYWRQQSEGDPICLAPLISRCAESELSINLLRLSNAIRFTPIQVTMMTLCRFILSALAALYLRL
jgi:hypothetical protein